LRTETRDRIYLLYIEISVNTAFRGRVNRR